MDRYGTPTGFRDYHNARNTPLPPEASEDEDVNAALLVASEWLDNYMRGSINGTKVGGREQVRELPRGWMTDAAGYAVPSDSVPVEAENATYEAALIQLRSPGSLSVNYVPGKYKSVSVDGAVSVTYATPGAWSDVQTQFAAVMQAIAPLLATDGAAGFSSLSGATSRV